MRYENWDVLLFPDGSKVPIQEFKTQCHVITNRDVHIPYLMTPVLTSFIPSLLPDSAFRVSIHSWERPRASRAIESMTRSGEPVIFEVQVLIDGVSVCSILNPDTPWPHLIDSNTEHSNNGIYDVLRFPLFHQEILQQGHWDAGDFHGRIRIVISEGFSRLAHLPSFEKVKDIITFSFQHAPLHILEQAGIAWPNAAMWLQASSTFCKLHMRTESTLQNGYIDREDTHAHSPARHNTLDRGKDEHLAWPSRIFPTSLGYHEKSSKERNFITEDPVLPDPFTEPFSRLGASRRKHSNAEDVSMPDCSSTSTSSRALSSMTGISYEHKRQMGPNCFIEEHLNHVIEALSPGKLTTNRAPKIPTIVSKPSAAAKARSASYTKRRPSSRSREASFSGTREVSGSSMKSESTMGSVIDKRIISQKTTEATEAINTNQTDKPNDDSYDHLEVTEGNSKM